MSRFIWILAVLVLAIGAIWLYNTHSHKDQLGSGLVTSRDSDTDASANGPSDTATAKPQGPPVTTAEAAFASSPAPSPGPGNVTTKPSVALPASDTIAPNPPNGTVFTGTGSYTWYRQGNITWRVDSATGASCIAFATLEEWQKRIVYTHSCRNA